MRPRPVSDHRALLKPTEGFSKSDVTVKVRQLPGACKPRVSEEDD